MPISVSISAGDSTHHLRSRYSNCSIAITVSISIGDSARLLLERSSLGGWMLRLFQSPLEIRPASYATTARPLIIQLPFQSPPEIRPTSYLRIAATVGPSRCFNLRRRFSPLLTCWERPAGCRRHPSFNLLRRFCPPLTACFRPVLV